MNLVYICLYFTFTKKPIKKRASKYEPKVKFEGSFEDMVKISITGAGAKKKAKSK